MSSPGHVVDLERVLESARFGGVTLAVCVLTSLTLIFDGFDIQAIAFAAPSLIRDWGITKADLSTVLAVGLMGMGLGALVVGRLGDHYGRRRALIVCMVLVAVASLLSAHAADTRELAFWRGVTGLGLGGALPNAAALMLEFAPTRSRNVTVAVTVVGVPIGGMVGSIVAGWIVPAFGWRAIFVVGAILPALLAAVLYRWLPESPRYLATRPDRGAELARLVNRVGAGASYDGSEVWTLRGEDGVRPGVKTLFRRGFRYNTLLIWLIFCTNVLAVYSFFNWVPTLLAGAGLPLPLALRGSLMFNLGGVVGSVGGALLMNRLGSRRVITALALLAVCSTYGIGRVPLGAAPALVPLYGLILLAGAAISGLQVNMYTVTGNAYPTRVRATGVGAALASARLGGVLSAYTGTFLMGAGGGLAPFFTGLSLVLLVTLAGVLLLRCHLPPTRPQTH